MVCNGRINAEIKLFRPRTVWHLCLLKQLYCESVLMGFCTFWTLIESVLVWITRNYTFSMLPLIFKRKRLMYSLVKLQIQVSIPTELRNMYDIGHSFVVSPFSFTELIRSSTLFDSDLYFQKWDAQCLNDESRSAIPGKYRPLIGQRC